MCVIVLLYGLVMDGFHKLCGRYQASDRANLNADETNFCARETLLTLSFDLCAESEPPEVADVPGHE